jgi:hypothetical protein
VCWLFVCEFQLQLALGLRYISRTVLTIFLCLQSWHRIHQVLPTGFGGNFTAGLFSALVVLAGQQLFRRFAVWQMFSPIAGEYQECEMPDGNPTSATGITIKQRGAVLHTTAINENGEVEWTGVINMNTLNPNVGDGTYHYSGRNDCGSHHVQRDPKTGDFIVLGANTSHPDASRRFNML